MGKIVRFGVSIPQELIRRFDQYVEALQFNSRSEALRQIIRDALVKEEWEEQGLIAGGISMVYDHHSRGMLEELMELQHQFHDLIISTQHVHLDHNNCLELLVVKGKAPDIQRLYNRLRGVKNLKHIGILKSTTG
ncbi:nickel-responsive transcriptional regulator NikR [bacterium]|nr:nickel-responsive transcriptional regulator NikR [bacterium]